jgi:hypothetical protein
MPRDNICINCGGAYRDDEMGSGLTCIYCEEGIDGPADEAAKEKPCDPIK